MPDDRGDPNVSYHRYRSNVPLDDLGIENDRALEKIADFIKQIQEKEYNIRAVVFACVLEEGKYTSAPNGKDANAAILGAGEFLIQIELLDHLYNQITADD